jgi:dTDP-4-amino-4,6-dideoxygalactose transaminase
VEADYPISRDALYQKFRDNEIWVRRYFYPLISEFPMYRGLPSANRSNLPVAANAALKVLCLPIHPALSNNDIDRIVSIVAGH